MPQAAIAAVNLDCRALFEKVLPKESVDGMMEDGKISPKKLSVTIISLKSPESSHLLRTIKDFTDGVIDVEDDKTEPEPERKAEPGQLFSIEELMGRKSDEGKEEGNGDGGEDNADSGKKED